MEDRRKETPGQTENSHRRQDPERPEVGAVAPSPGAGVPATKRDVASLINWPTVLYLFVLGVICIFLAPITVFWWIVPVFGVAVPAILGVLDRPALRRPNDKKLKERELLEALAERGELTPTTAAMRTSLTAGEASKMLEDLAGKGHMELRIEEDVMAYALRERDRHEVPGRGSAPLGVGSDRARRISDPLSERELEVLNLLASGKTNSEVARDLYVSVGTVKSHTGNIYRKLNARNRAEALARARELKMLP